MATTMDYELEDRDLGKSSIRQRTQASHQPSHHADQQTQSADVDRSQLAKAGKRQVLQVQS